MAAPSPKPCAPCGRDASLVNALREVGSPTANGGPWGEDVAELLCAAVDEVLAARRPRKKSGPVSDYSNRWLGQLFEAVWVCRQLERKAFKRN